MADLKKDEQEHVRAAVRFLKVQCGTWDSLARGLGYSTVAVRWVMEGRRVPSGGMAIRAARLANVSVDDVLDGTYPPANCCPHCSQPLLAIPTHDA